jgi:hypothetical protein
MSQRINTPALADLPDPSMIELAWAAGFTDGEGCLSIARQTYTDPRRRATYRMRVDIMQNNLEVLTDFERAVGLKGRIYAVKRHHSQNRDCYRIAYDGEAAFELIRRLHPFLRRKRHEADVSLQFERTCQLSRHFGPKGCPEAIWVLRARFYRKLQALK